MTIKETYNYLLQVRILDGKIHNCILQRETLRSCLLPSGIRYDTDKVQVSPSDQMSEIEAQVMDLEQKIQHLEAKKKIAIVSITKAIYKLPNENEQTVLMEYYIGKKSVEQIADGMNISTRGTYYIKRKAISNISKFL